MFWVVDNGRSHRGERCHKRLARQWPNLIVVHTPIHTSWLNQVEIYFSIVQRKVLTPNDLNSITALEDRLLAFQNHYQSAAKPLQWRFTRRDPASLLEKLAACPKAAWSAEYVTELPGWSTKLGAWRRAAAARALRLWRASGYFTKR